MRANIVKKVKVAPQFFGFSGKLRHYQFVCWMQVTSIKEAKALINKRIASKQNNK